MLRCIELAKKGLGNTFPNPSVGCVIVHEGKVIGEGFTSPYGGNHAEVNAIQSVKDDSPLKEATLYVTLEPCSHFGKTPPCSDLIIREKIPTVFIGCLDDNHLVSGNGIKKLKDAGASVTVGVLEQECRNQHRRFFTFQNKNRPYIILKWAQTKDDFIAPLYINRSKTEPVWITSPTSRQLVHKWRTQEHAILVGTKTVLDDNPSLTARDWKGKSPIRVVIDRTLKIPETFSVYNKEAITIFVTEEKKENEDQIYFETIDFTKSIANQICTVLHKHQIVSLIVEGGSKTLQTFIDENLWDEARVFIGDKMFSEGVKAPLISSEKSSEEHIESDILIHYIND